MLAIDCAEDYGAHATKLKSLGVDAVIRYFNPLTKGHDSGKSLRPAEAKLYAADGLKVGIVVEGYGMANGTGIDHQSGLRDAQEVLDWLPSVGIQPSPALVVWFAVDTDVNANQINNQVVAYFDAIHSVFNAQPLRPRVGIYGSGWACFSMVGTKRADVSWVAGSHGWEHYQSYVASNSWTLLQHIGPHEMWNGFNADTNDVNEQHGTAGFVTPFDTSASSGHTGEPTTPTVGTVMTNLWTALQLIIPAVANAWNIISADQGKPWYVVVEDIINHLTPGAPNSPKLNG